MARCAVQHPWSAEFLASRAAPLIDVWFAAEADAKRDWSDLDRASVLQGATRDLISVLKYAHDGVVHNGHRVTVKYGWMIVRKPIG